MLRYLVVFLVCMALLLPQVSYAGAEQVTLFYDIDIPPLYGQEVADLCEYAHSNGVALQCFVIDSTIAGDAISQALISGPVILPLHLVDGNEEFRSHLVDIGKLIRNDGLPQVIKAMTHESMWGLLSIAQIPALFYNRDLVTKFNGPSAQTHTSWSSFISVLQTWVTKTDPIVKAEYNLHGFGMSWEELLAAWVATTNEANVNPFWPWDFNFRQKLIQLRKLKQNGIRLDGIDKQDTWQAFVDGKLPVTFGYLSQVSDIPDNINWTVTPLPGDCSYNHLQPAEYWALLDTTRHGSGWQVYRWLFLGEGAGFLAANHPLTINLLNLVHSTVIPVDLQVRGVSKVMEATARVVSVDTGDIWRTPEVKLAVREYLNGTGNLDNASLEIDKSYHVEIGLQEPEFIVDESELVILPFNIADNSGYKWAPSDARLAHWSKNGVEIVDVATQTLEFTTPMKTEDVVWSQDGKQLTLVVDDMADNHGLGANDIIVLDLTTGHTTEVAPSTLNDNQPVWSPDGAQLAFSSVVEPGNTDILVTDGKSNDYHNITSSPAQDLKPEWLPDGRRLLFLSDREGSGKSLYSMNIDSSDVRLIKQLDVPDGKYLISPDGRRVAFLSQLSERTESLSVIDLASGEQKNILDERYRVTSFVWSPEGSKLAVTLSLAGYYQLLLIDAESGEISPCFVRGASGLISWSPDGRYIAFSGYNNGQNAMLLISASGKLPIRVLGSGKLTVNPLWSADGSMLVCAVLNNKTFRIEGIYAAHPNLP